LNDIAQFPVDYQETERKVKQVKAKLNWVKVNIPNVIVWKQTAL